MAATVLVVEDERKLRDLVRSYLERAGFTVLSTGSGAEAITMAADAAPDLVVLDLGLPDVPGIPAEDLPRIFDRFWRGQQATQVSGSGIGLAVAAELAQAHGGRLSANSEPGRGTQMTLTLPKA